MKVSGTIGSGAAPGLRGASRPATGEGFRIAGPEESAGLGQVGSAAGVHGVMGIEALLALQDVGTPTERRRRSVRRAGRILDVLDEIMVALLEGSLDSASLDRLRRALRDERSQTEDPALESVLDEIELRAAVEMAKLEQASRAA